MIKYLPIIAASLSLLSSTHALAPEELRKPEDAAAISINGIFES